MIWRKSTARDAVLHELDTDGWKYGLVLIRATRVRAGLFYRVITELEAEGLVEARWAQLEPGNRYRRRLYRLTA